MVTRRALLNLILTGAGIALLVWQVDAVGGIDTVTEGLRRVGTGFGLILLLALARFGLRSYAWMALIRESVPLSSATAATISGDALGNLTPLGLAASEPAKALYLARHVEPARGFAALTAENFFYSVSVAIYIVIGASAMVAWFDLPDPIQRAAFVTLGFMAIVLIAAGWIAWQRPAALSAVLSRIPSRRLAAVVDRVREFEVRTYGSAGHQGARLGVVAVSEAGFHVISFLESWLTLYLLTGTSQPMVALILDSVNRVINVVFKIVPMRMGVDEVGSEIVAASIGMLEGVGLQAALVRRVRMLFWAATGLAIWGMAMTSRKNRKGSEGSTSSKGSTSSNP